MGQQNLPPDHDEQLLTLGRTLQSLREEENADVLIETTLEYLKNEFKYRLIWIALYDRLEHRLVGKSGITPNGEITLLKQRYNLYPGDLLEQVVIQQRAVGVPDLRQEVRAGVWRQAAQEFAIQGTLLFPLRCKDRCYGLVLLGSSLWGVSPRPAEKARLSIVLGGLAGALYELELEWQRSSSKRPEQTMFAMLNRIQQVPTLPLRLEAVVNMTQDFILPTRTNIYWYSPQRYFWHRLGSRQALRRYGQSRSHVPGLRVTEVNDFYQALNTGQLVTIGSAKSLLSSESTKRLLVRLQTRSLMAAPIQANGELLGFLAVEDNQARIWEESECNYLSATAQLVGLVANQEDLEATLTEAQKDARFTAELATAIAKPYLPSAQTASSQTMAALKECATLLLEHLEAKLFLVLQEQDHGQFSLIFAPPSLKRLGLLVFAPLNANERQLLLASNEVMMIEDLAEDERLLAWHQVLGELAIRSLIITKIANPNDDQKLSLLIVGCQTPRTWSLRSRNLVGIVAQQIQLLLLVQHYADAAQQSFQLYQTLKDGLAILAAAPLDPVLFEQCWIDYLSTCLECPITALFSWTSDSDSATVAAAVVTEPHFALSPNLAIPIVNNQLIEEAIASRSWLAKPVSELPEAIALSLMHLGLTQILIIALHTDETPIKAFILLAHAQLQFPSHLLLPTETLIFQFAWERQYRYSLSQQAQDNQTLQMLNWYKHRCLEKLHRSVTQSLAAFLDFQAVMPLPNLAPVKEKSLQQMRHKQLLQQLQETLGILSPVLQDEEWQLNLNVGSLPLAGLLKRSLHQVEPLFERQQIRLQVHNSSDKNVHGDLLKLECILYELFVTVCLCANPGSRLNLWCCPVPAGLELLIAESSSLEECLQIDSTCPSPLTINLIVCQYLLHSWGGDLQFYQLKSDMASLLPRTGRSVIKLTLPQ